MTDAEKFAAVLAAIADGAGVRAACAAHGVDMAAFLENVDAERYALARDVQADAHFDELAELEAACLKGELDPRTFRAALDSRKWRLARIKPRSYGERAIVEQASRMDEEAALSPREAMEAIRARGR